MNGTTVRRWFAREPEDTEALGAGFSRSIPAGGGRALIVHLIGDLGAGKTTWARGFLQALGASHVRSPTFALLEVHELPTITVAHLDLYRLRVPAETGDLGLGDLDAAGHVWLVEWPERAGESLPPPDLRICLGDDGPRGRIVSVAAFSALGEAWLEAAAHVDRASTGAALMDESSPR
jgi:tRNA threonylcarbamoyladenosine biosynthesis protein TsaE